MAMRNLLIALLAGILFGAGLVISGMANPAKVLAFLRIDAAWDPSLAFVMGGALAITLPGFAWLRRRQKPLFADQFVSPALRPIDRRLVLGALVFGLGWGLAGYCPGPALVSAALLQPMAWVFVPSMLIGGWLSRITFKA
jgi:uncharacterized membrane protein YedE/YeeE